MRAGAGVVNRIPPKIPISFVATVGAAPRDQNTRLRLQQWGGYKPTQRGIWGSSTLPHCDFNC